MALQKTIYKLAKSGKIQTWQVELDESKGRYRTISGLEDGQKVTSNWTVCEGKNIGRSNETSPVQQAKAEVEAHYTKKLAQGGYFKDKKEAASGAKTFIQPMLAKQYEDYKPTESDFASGKVFCQPKLDGVRCIATKNGLWSRQGKPIVTCSHIIAALAPLFAKDSSLILDGELYSDKFKDNFNEIISLVRREDVTPGEYDKCRENIKYHIYDVVCVKEKTDLKFSQRTKIIDALKLIQHNYLIPVKTDNPLSAEELDKFFADYLSDGYEGQMIRLDLPYESSRSASLLKRKEFIDEEFTILDILEGTGNRSGMAGTIVYQLHDDLPVFYPDSTENTFRSGIAGGETHYIALLKNRKKYIGGQGTVTFFDYTPAGKPRFPVTKTLFTKKRDL